MKILRVGDPHITVRNLEEGEKLIEFIRLKAIEYKVGCIEFMGDLMHTHAVIRVEVLDFWERAFNKLTTVCPVLSLVGNHDQPGSKEKEQLMNALNIFNGEDLSIVNKPMIHNNIAYIPYMSDKEQFLSVAKDLYIQGATEMLIAHQNFSIPLYSDMIDPNLVPQKYIITGHIHEQKHFNKVLQVGTPKWDTLTDANENKGIWIFEHAMDGSLTYEEYISTKDVVTPITKITLNEGDAEVELDPNARNYLELVGSSAWINQMKKKYKGLAQLKARPSDRKNVNVNKDKAFSVLEFLDASFKPIDGVEKAEIKQYLQEVINV